MTFILVTLTLALIIGVEWYRSSKRKLEDRPSEMITEHPNLADVFERYFHPGHTWALITGARSIKVGSDDFSSRVVGSLTAVDLPRVGQKVHQGEPIARLHHGNRVLLQLSPVTGRILQVNTALSAHPTILNDSPFELGWIARVKPEKLELDLRNLLKGVVAERWHEAVRYEIVQFFSPNVGAALQDGGELVPDLGDHCTDKEWENFVQKFFPKVTTQQIQTNRRTKELPS